MTMVVSLGLSRFYYSDPKGLRAAARTLVESGATPLHRELLGELDAKDCAVLEVRRGPEGVEERILPPKEAERIFAALRRTYAKSGSYASFSWDQTEKLGIWDAAALALALDPPDRRRVTLPGVREELSVIDLARSARNYTRRHPQCTTARALHRLAQDLSMVVHTA